MKRTYILSGLAMLAIASCGLQSCSDDKTATPLEVPAAAANPTGIDNYKTLSFAWNAVKGANQYGYELQTPDGTTVVKDVTELTEVSITDLTPDTEYTFTVWAFAPVYTDYVQSDVLKITKRTDPLIPVPTPALNVEEEVLSVIATWYYDEHSDYYHYTLKKEGSVVEDADAYAEYEDEDGEWYTRLQFNNLENGTYELTVTSLPWEDGYGESEKATQTFTVNNTLLWTVTGTYTKADGSQMTRTMEAYDNDRYRILEFYGVEGYDLCWQFDPTANPNRDDYTLWFAEPYNESTFCYEIPTGLGSSVLSIDNWYGDSNMSGDRNGGQVFFMVGGYDTGKFDKFVW